MREPAKGERRELSIKAKFRLEVVDYYRRIRGTKPAPEAEARAAGKKISGFGMKHVYLPGKKQYAFCAADIRAKEALVHIAPAPPSASARKTLAKTAAYAATLANPVLPARSVL